MEPPTPLAPADPRGLKRELLRLSLKLGAYGFGGGMALVAMARHRLVDQKRWIDDETFLRDLAIAQSIPGGTISNLVTLLGRRAGGLRTALACVAIFLLPSILLMAALGAAYTWTASLAPVEAAFDGMRPAVVAITFAVGITFLRLLSRWQIALGLAAAAVVIPHWLSLFETVALTAILTPLLVRLRRRPPALLSVSWPVLALVFAQISLSMFGGGLAMIPVVEHQLVIQRHWLAVREFTDGITLAQITPGPLATVATFFGYRIDGPWGAVVATLAVFVPPLILILGAARFLEANEKREDVRLTLAALSAVTLGSILAAGVSLARSGGISPVWPYTAIDGGLALLGLVALLRGLGPLWVIAATAALRLAASAW